MISQLNQRERMFVIVGGLALVLALLYFAVVAPYRSALSRLDRQIVTRSGQLQEVKVLQDRYLAMQKQMSQVARLLGKRQDFS
ncbi:MAG: type II secretion system protein GspM, partial [Desulfuromonadales bacterium]|nr:type II secretion system protein GspM [Desulfuromonadales bacterium]